MNTRKLSIVLMHALVGWALCAATMGVSIAKMPLHEALAVPCCDSIHRNLTTVAGLGEMLVIGIVYGLTLHPAI